MTSTPDPWRRALEEATRRTRDGDLVGATEALQRALGGLPGGMAGTGPAGWPTAGSATRAVRPVDDDVIDVEARVVETPDASPSAPPGAGPAAPTSERAPPVSDPAPAPATAERPAPAAGPARFDRRPAHPLAGEHAEPAGTREYRLWLPPPGPLPAGLVVMLHGCHQDPDDFAAGTAMHRLAMQAGCAVLYPGQSARANPQRCWNWFKRTHQQRGRGEASILAGMAAAVVARHELDAGRVWVAGLSAGGAMAAILGATYPDRFAAVGIHSGLPAGAARDLPSALAAMRDGVAEAPRGRELPPTIVFHGEADMVVNPRNGALAADLAAHAGGAAATEELDGRSAAGRRWRCRRHLDVQGRLVAEHWLLHGAGHAWSGGQVAGSYTDPAGPDASAAMLRFFLDHPKR